MTIFNVKLIAGQLINLIKTLSRLSFKYFLFHIILFTQRLHETFFFNFEFFLMWSIISYLIFITHASGWYFVIFNELAYRARLYVNLLNYRLGLILNWAISNALTLVTGWFRRKITFRRRNYTEKGAEDQEERRARKRENSLGRKTSFSSFLRAGSKTL